MYRRELIIGLLGAGLGLSFYSIANLLDNFANVRAWIGLISGIFFFIILVPIIRYIENKEKEEKYDRDEKLLLTFERTLHQEFGILINEIREDRNERNKPDTKPETRNNNTTK
jgi:hypothetical protein